MKSAATVKPDVLNGITAQGFYVIGASGTAFGFNNNRSVERVLQLMDRGLAQFKPANEPKPEELSSWGTKSYANRPDPSMSVLRIFARIQPPVAGADPSNENVVQDHIWIQKSELQSLIDSGQLPTAAIYRLYRFALVDNIRGEPDHWQQGELKTAVFDVKKVIEVDGKTTYSVSGKFEMATANGQRGLEGKLEGRIIIDLNRASISDCKIFAEAKAWGKGTYTPNPPPGKFRMVFAIVPATDSVAKMVAPQAIFYGQEYFNPKR